MRILQVCAKFHPYAASGSTKVACMHDKAFQGSV